MLFTEWQRLSKDGSEGPARKFVWRTVFNHSEKRKVFYGKNEQLVYVNRKVNREGHGI
jgi:hypothetical protein